MALKPLTVVAKDAHIELFEKEYVGSHNALISKLNDVAYKLHSIPMENHYIRDTIIIEVSKALMETKKYFRSLEANSPRSEEAEGRLVMLWGLVAAPIGFIDKDLAILCALEQENWLHPDGWSPEEIKEFVVKLDSVSRKFMRLSFPVSVWH
ncbi:hypothetical protein N480_03530 [Pseudoalteromonas luteoviolacea S2607]|uniref:hypothetical protein n=1 Tax=Pseudoalteromonas luteoviolacea TaxID=43657 RepID=UPI0007B07E93|nr:hypothetical protein [Pseudoalteromonas luteoviolacea]KZN30028.1 hypothetical protein N480_03530 [Pseudoalteromonas luteoviolacea S2607]